MIARLADDLRAEFPDMRGLTRSNLSYMRRLAVSWPDRAIVPTVLGRLSWSHLRCLLDKLSDQSARDWYATAAVEHGWSLSGLDHQIMNRLRERSAGAPSNFATQLSGPESELAQQLTKDPYVFDFLSLTDTAAERDLENALMDRLQDTLLELDRGFAFVGRQVHFDVDGDDFLGRSATERAASRKLG